MNKLENKITTEMLHQFAEELMFNLSEQHCQNLLLDFNGIIKQMAIVTEIDTTNIEPLDYPLPIINTLLRADTIGTSLTSKSVLELAPEVENDYITINQVIDYEN